MTQEEFEIGDTVMLKSTSFAMTINSIDKETETAECCWEDKKRRTLKRETFALAALTRHERGPIVIVRSACKTNEEESDDDHSP